jgi:hypothetical protein
MKACFKCHTAKPLEDFYRHPRMADGRLNKCKTCAKKDVDAREKRLFATNPEWTERELARQRAKSSKARSEGKTSPHTRKALIAWQARNQIKRLAHNRVAKAVAVGKLIKQPCQTCGDVKAQAHHEDYSKPLDVVWLCTTHHSERHVEINKERRQSHFSV